MSTTPDAPKPGLTGVPELTPLGRRLEMLRLDRGLSKQALARAAGTSRQQLWRVMTGKSELTPAFCQRLAEVLGVDAHDLRRSGDGLRARDEIRRAAATRLADPMPDATRSVRAPSDAGRPTVAEYLADPRWVARTLATCPGGNEGRLLKRRILDGLEDAARDAGVKLPPAFFAVRGRVVNGEL
jgi:transcriptional regulator with XRE-family HTH domain